MKIEIGNYYKHKFDQGIIEIISLESGYDGDNDYTYDCRIKVIEESLDDINRKNWFDTLSSYNETLDDVAFRLKHIKKYYKYLPAYGAPLYKIINKN